MICLKNLNSLLKESQVQETDTIITVDDLVIDPDRQTVQNGGEPIKVSRTEFKVLTFLAGQPGRVLSRKDILSCLYGDKHAVSDRAVDVQIVGLRRKLGPARKYIETVRSIGYRFKA